MENNIITDTNVLEVTENFGGFTAIKKCLVCNDRSVFTGTCKTKEIAIKAVSTKFDEIHLDCNFSSTGGSSAVGDNQIRNGF